MGFGFSWFQLFVGSIPVVRWLNHSFRHRIQSCLSAPSLRVSLPVESEECEARLVPQLEAPVLMGHHWNRESAENTWILELPPRCFCGGCGALIQQWLWGFTHTLGDMLSFPKYNNPPNPPTPSSISRDGVYRKIMTEIQPAWMVSARLQFSAVLWVFSLDTFWSIAIWNH